MDKGETSEKNTNEERLFDETIFKEHLKNKLILLFDSVIKYIFKYSMRSFSIYKHA